MYLTDAVVLNSGALGRFTLKAQFNADGTPKPILFVGGNGSGKTSLLSILADVLIEIAALALQKVTPAEGIGRQFFRILGGRSVRLESSFELSAARLIHGAEEFFYRANAGTVTPSDVAGEMAAFGPVAHWQTDKNQKIAFGPTANIPAIYNEGAYAFFPASRFEMPHWANKAMLERDPEADFSAQFGGVLHKPIVVQTSVQELKPWILELLVDSNINIVEILMLPTLEAVKTLAVNKNSSSQPALNGLGAIVSAILQRPAYVSRLLRGRTDGRICIAADNKILLPTLESLSSGQASLLSIFGTALRYGDSGQLSKAPSQIEGIVLIDEIDAHLHADLQHEALPALIKLFPRIQFIVTSHSPLFPLGMRKIFGDDGFTLIELPSGLTIDAERFSEFESSFAYFQATKAFEASLTEKARSSQRPLVLCEGETDPKYLKAAATVLNMDDLVAGADFEWIGKKESGGEAQGGGYKNLDSALRFLRNNPQFISRRIVLLYDVDTNKEAADYDGIFIRRLPKNEENQRAQSGIENLLPEPAIEDKFYTIKEKTSGTTLVTTRELRKTELCSSLCDHDPKPENFAKFAPPLMEIRLLLFPQTEGKPDHVAPPPSSNDNGAAPSPAEEDGSPMNPSGQLPSSVLSNDEPAS